VRKRGLPCASLPPYDSQVRFTCSRCGKRYASTDEPVSGRIYAIGCKCGHTIVVKGPEVSGGVRNGTPAVVREDPFSAFHEKYQLPSAVGAPKPARPAAAAQQRSGPSAEPVSHADSDADSLWAWRSSPPAPAEPEPAPLPFDPVAAGHGLLLDVDHAQALSSGSMTTEVAPLPPPQDDDEVSITFSEKLPLSPEGARRPWLLAAATALALLVVAGGAVAVLSRRPRSLRPHEHEAPLPVPPAAAPPFATATPPAPAAALPQNAPGPPLAARPVPQPPAAPAAAPRPARAAEGSARPLTGSRPPRPARRTSSWPVVTAEPAPPRSGPAVSPALLDLLSRKADAPAAPPKPETRGASPGVNEVQAAVERDRSAFDACLEEAGSDGPVAGRQVVLAVTRRCGPRGLARRSLPHVRGPEARPPVLCRGPGPPSRPSEPRPLASAPATRRAASL
jgi:DNA-directed RNA polymerase subunit RPC12/RpoP